MTPYEAAKVKRALPARSRLHSVENPIPQDELMIKRGDHMDRDQGDQDVREQLVEFAELMSDVAIGLERRGYLEQS